jgi:hypothetical protein
MTPDNLRDVLAEALHPILEAVRLVGRALERRLTSFANLTDDREA